MAENIVFNITGNSKKLEDAIKSTQARMKRLQSTMEDLGKGARSTQKNVKSFNDLGSAARRAQRPIRDLQRVNLRRLNNSVSTLRNRMKSVTVTVNRVVTAMAGVGITIVLFRTAAHSVVRFEKAMGEVAAITNATADSFRMLQAEAMRLGSSTMFSGEQAAQGLKFLAMAGLDAQQATQALEATLNLAQAGAMNLGDAADIASNIMTAFRKEATELNDIVDDLATIASSSNTSIQQLGDAMKYVSASASAFGISLQEANAAIGVLSNAGMQASMAGTGLRQVLVRLSGQSAAMRQGMAALGITFAEINPEVNTLTEIIDRFARTSITATQITSMFGARAANAFANLLAGRDTLVALTEAQATNSGRAQEMADVMGNTLFGSLKKVQSAYENFFQVLYNSEGVATSVQGALGKLANIINYFAGSMSAFEGNPLTEFGENASVAYQETAKLAEKITEAVELVVKFGAVLGGLAILKAVGSALTFLHTQMTLYSTGLAKGAIATSKFSADVVKSDVALNKLGLRLTTARGRLVIYAKTKRAVGAATASVIAPITRLRASIAGLSASSFSAARGMSLLNKSISATSIISAVASKTTAGLGAAMMFASRTARVFAGAMRILAFTIGSLTVVLGLVYIAIEAIAYFWPNTFTNGDEAGAAKRVEALKNEVEELGKVIKSAELQIEMEVGEDGVIRAKQAMEGFKDADGVKIVPFKEIKNVEDLNNLLKVKEDLLRKAQNQMNELQSEIKSMTAEGSKASRDEIETIRQKIRDNSDYQDELENNIKFITENGEAYVAQVQAVESLQGAVTGLNNKIKELDTASSSAGLTIQGQFENVSGTIDQVRMKIGQLMDSETTRAQAVTSATQALIEKEQELATLRQQNAGGGKIEKAQAAVKVAQINLDAAKSGTTSTGLGGQGGTRRRRELSSDQEQALSQELDTFKKALSEYDSGKGMSGETVFIELSQSMQNLKDAGFGDIANFDQNASGQEMSKQIENIQTLMRLTEQLNAQKKLRNAMEGQINAELEGRSTKIYEDEIKAIQDVITLQEKLTQIEADKRKYAAQTKGRGREMRVTKGMTSDASEGIMLGSDSFEENKKQIIEVFETIQSNYSATKALLEGEIRAKIAVEKEKQSKQELNTDARAETTKRIADLETQLKGVSGFGREGKKGGSKFSTEELVDSMRNAFSGLSEFDELDENVIKPANLDGPAEERVKLEQKLLEFANKFLNQSTAGDDKIQMKMEIAQEKSSASTAKRFSEEIKVSAEKQKQINLLRQENELLLIQEKLRKNIDEQAKLANEGPGTKGGVENIESDKKAQEEYDSRMSSLKAEQSAIEGDMGVVTAEIQAANQAIAKAVAEVESNLVKEIREIQKGTGNEDEKKVAIEEAKAAAEKNVLKQGRVAGERAGDDAAVKQDLKDAQSVNKLEEAAQKKETDMQKAEQDAQRKAQEAANKAQAEKEKEAFAIAKEKAPKDSAGEIAVSSLAKIGGGGGVGVGGNLEEKQLQVQEQAAEILKQMLGVLQTPDEFGGDKNLAFNEMMGKLTDDEKQVMVAGLDDIVKQAQDPNTNQQQRESLKEQAQALINNLAGKAAERNFNPKGEVLPKELFPLPNVNPDNGMNGNNAKIENQKNPAELIAQTNSILERIEDRLNQTVILGGVAGAGGGVNV